jgi:hypothetical protein
VRRSITTLASLGRFPEASGANRAVVAEREAILAAIEPPLSDEEACALASLFGPDDCFELAWVLVHLIESAPGWPLAACMPTEPMWNDVMTARIHESTGRPPS